MYLCNPVGNDSFVSIHARIEFVEYFKWKLVFSNNEWKLISDPDRKKKINKGKFVLGNVRTKPKSNILFGKNKVTFSGTFAIQLEMTFWFEINARNDLYYTNCWIYELKNSAKGGRSRTLLWETKKIQWHSFVFFFLQQCLPPNPISHLGKCCILPFRKKWPECSLELPRNHPNLHRSKNIQLYAA